MAVINDGHPTIISLANGVVLKEKTITPIGVDGGDAVDTTTMRNSTLRTKQPRRLKDTTDGSMTCAYDPAFLVTAMSQLNVNQLITITFPDGEVYSFWGWMKTFKPNEIKEGEQPTAECVFVSGNQNGSGVETVPTIS